MFFLLTVRILSSVNLCNCDFNISNMIGNLLKETIDIALIDFPIKELYVVFTTLNFYKGKNYTVVVETINTIKTTFFLNFNFDQALKQTEHFNN